MSERLYYTDSYRTRFSACVTERCTWDGHPAVVLDHTAFYPTSGGQPSDRGTLDGVAVLDVVVREQDNAIVHVLDAALPGSEVEGLLDWPRRFDHMQQHTGQHVLSAAFEQLLDAGTVGFHLGVEICTIDVDVARLEPAAVAPVEKLVNRVLWQNRPVGTRFVDPDELSALPLRRPPDVQGPVRIVDIGPATTDVSLANTLSPDVSSPDVSSAPGQSFDVNPCGGTHVARTGEIGLLKILRLEYRGDETRVEFLCGERALRDYESKNEVLSRLATKLTVGYWELEQAVERLQAEGKQLRKTLRQTRKRLLAVEAAELAETATFPSQARGHKPYRVVCKVWEPADQKSPEDLRALARELTQYPDVAAFLLSAGDERIHLIFARDSKGDVDLDVSALLRDACMRLGGKGGGRPHMAQGSAPAAAAGRLTVVLADLLSPLGISIS